MSLPARVMQIKQHHSPPQRTRLRAHTHKATQLCRQISLTCGYTGGAHTPSGLRGMCTHALTDRMEPADVTLSLSPLHLYSAPLLPPLNSMHTPFSTHIATPALAHTRRCAHGASCRIPERGSLTRQSTRLIHIERDARSLARISLITKGPSSLPRSHTTHQLIHFPSGPNQGCSGFRAQPDARIISSAKGRTTRTPSTCVRIGQAHTRHRHVYTYPAAQTRA